MGNGAAKLAHGNNWTVHEVLDYLDGPAFGLDRAEPLVDPGVTLVMTKSPGSPREPFEMRSLATTTSTGAATTSTGTEVLCRRLDISELPRVAEIDRSETISAIYVQRGTRLELVPGDRSAPAWDPEGTGEHSIASQREALVALIASGAAALGAFDGDRLLGIGVVLAHLRPSVAQLAYLHVSDGFRGRGIGGRLSDELERFAREAGDTSIVVSATPSYNTVGFYRRRGYELMAEPFPELYDLEPEDVHMKKLL